jgi:hypothetical protein
MSPEQELLCLRASMKQRSERYRQDKHRHRLVVAENFRLKEELRDWKRRFDALLHIVPPVSAR